MSLPQLLAYAALQGLSEFLPISSSAHLILLERSLTLETIPRFMEAAVHLGSLGVLFIYFRNDIRRLFTGLFQTTKKQYSKETYFLKILFLASVPAVVIGLFLDKTLGRALFENLEIIGWTTLIFGAFLYLSDRFPRIKTVDHIKPSEAFGGWGLAQCLAFVHGVSRSGVCITYGRFQGYKRLDAVRFAFLMAIPALSGACVLKGWAFYKAHDFSNLGTLGLGALISFMVGLLTIHVMMRLVRTAFLQKLALYRITLGLIILYGVYILKWT